MKHEIAEQIEFSNNHISKQIKPFKFPVNTDQQ